MSVHFGSVSVRFGSVWLRLAPFRVRFGSVSGWGRGEGFCKGKNITTLTSLKSLGRFSCAILVFGVFPLFLPLAITAFGSPKGYSSLAIVAFGAFESTVPKYDCRLRKVIN